MSGIHKVVKQALYQGFEDQAPQMSAALAFYLIFSLAPILVVVIAIAGLVFGQKAALDQIVGQFQQLIGRQSAEAVQAMIEASVNSTSTTSSTVIGVITLLVGATGALVELQGGLNRVWKVRAVSDLSYLLKQRLTSLALVAGITFLLLVSLVISAALSAIGTLFNAHMTVREALWHGMDFSLSCFVITALFALIFKTLPDVFIPWKDVWVGAAVTAVFFTAGKLLVGLYIGKSSLLSSFGAAGSLAAILMWVYYSALVLYFGAEFTKAYADRFGSSRT